METMRVYEFSRDCGVPSKELLAILKQAGFDVSSHMSMLSEKELDFLRKKFLKPEVTPMKKQQAPNIQTTKKQEIAEKSLNKEQKIEPKSEKKIEVAPEKIVKQEKPAIEKKKETTPITPHKIPSKNAPVYSEKKLETEQEKKSLSVTEDIILEPMLVAEFADKAHKLASDVILTLLRMGIMVTKNQVIKEDVISRLAEHYQIKTVKKSEQQNILQGIAASEGVLTERPPVVVVVGHVDHGKTTLLDFIRKTKVAAKEKGGITQHLGAYEVNTPQGNIIFLDTPGHEAFSKMRGRGIGVADIAILIVAADDGVMPQTVEAIKFAQEAKLPIIVAINKVDKVDHARIESVRRGLAQYGLLPEEWGGDVICIPISAKTGLGVEQLLEMIILQAELMELKADVNRSGIGYVLESKPEKGRGPMATILCKQGTVHIGDYFVCGNTVGKVTSLVNSYGFRIQEVGPAVPVAVAGFEALPEVGSLFKVVTYDEYAKAKDVLSDRKMGSQKIVTAGALNLIIKTDSISTKEALLGAMDKIAKNVGKEFNIVNAGIGPVSESDVALADSTGSSILTLHVKPEVNAALLARHNNVSIEIFDIIYKLLEYLEVRIKGKKEVVMVKTKIGQAIVRAVFTIKNVGVVAGCYVSEGRFTRDGSVIIYRRNKEIGAGLIKSLQRDRKTVKEVHTGFECGFLVAGFEDFAIDDRIDCYIEEPAK
jgi:translation initiation factor IF-2